MKPQHFLALIMSAGLLLSACSLNLFNGRKHHLNLVRSNKSDCYNLSKKTEKQVIETTENIFTSTDLVYTKPNTTLLEQLIEKKPLNQAKNNTSVNEKKTIQHASKYLIVNPKKEQGLSIILTKNNKLRPIAKFTFITGIIGFVFVFIWPLTILAFPIGLIAIISGIIAFSKIKNIRSADFKYAFIGFILGMIICTAWIGFLMMLSK